MIIPMKKITLVVLDREKTEALGELRKLGVLHVERREASSQSLVDVQALAAKLDQASAILSEIKVPKTTSVKDHLDRDATMALVDRVLSLSEERRGLLETVNHVQHELDRLSPWGDVDPKGFDYLASKGLYLFPFEIPIADYASLPENAKSIVVGRDKKAVRFVLWGEDDLLPTGMPESARELTMPESSTADLRLTLKSALTRIPEIVAEIAESAPYLGSILSVRNDISKEFEFETVRSGMVKVEFDGDGEIKRNAGLAWLTGFVPLPEERALAERSSAHGWAYISDDPSAEDIVPTKLKNNRLVNLISPLFDFLGITPGYNELDISVWFILFFGIFFAMIFGDGGYGLVISLIASFGIVSSSRKQKKVPTIWYMLLYLGAMTVAWGVITCTWFGVPMESVPAFLKAIALPAFSNVNPEAPTNIKIFCFTLGLIQISLAHIIGVIRNIRSPKMLGELGTLMMTGGMYFVVLNLVVDSQKYPLSNLVIGIILAGFLLNFLFINYSGSVGNGILESLKNSITMFLGVVNVFGDIMSYIRLWAVGLAGAAISATVNSMVGPMFGSFLMFLGVLLLTFGHGLNFIMNVLSVIVHGVRLNTLEFSNHLGLTWSGFKYEPFSETVRK